MNPALVTLIRKYEMKAEATKEFPKVAAYYRIAANAVLVLALKQ